jgi:sulfide:quinone oxidoreductase
MHVYTMEGAPMATAGPEMGALIQGELERRGIAFHPKKKSVALHPERREIEFEDGERAHYDLALAVPPHVAPRAVMEAGLVNASGWIPVNPQTLELAGGRGARPVYALGDVATVALPGAFDPRMPLALPKAGVFASAHGDVAARHLAARILGRSDETARFDGVGFCYMETGAGMAMRADGSFFDLPHPRMRREAPSAARFREKQQWVRGLPDV